MRPSAVLIIGMLAATPAVAQSVAEKTGVNSALGISPKTADFVKEAAASDMFEIASSRLAAERGNEQTKAFAMQMVAAHEKTTAELKDAVSSGATKAELPTAMMPAQQKKIDKLKSLQGASFDKEYRSDQVGAHKSAVSLFKRYAKSGDNAALKAWSGKTEPDLEQHLKMAQALK